MKIKMVCEKCGKDGEKDMDKSNLNWSIYKNKCRCGGKIIPKLIDNQKG